MALAPAEPIGTSRPPSDSWIEPRLERRAGAGHEDARLAVVGRRGAAAAGRW